MSWLNIGNWTRGWTNILKKQVGYNMIQYNMIQYDTIWYNNYVIIVSYNIFWYTHVWLYVEYHTYYLKLVPKISVFDVTKSMDMAQANQANADALLSHTGAGISKGRPRNCFVPAHHSNVSFIHRLLCWTSSLSATVSTFNVFVPRVESVAKLIATAWVLRLKRLMLRQVKLAQKAMSASAAGGRASQQLSSTFGNAMA